MKRNLSIGQAFKFAWATFIQHPALFAALMLTLFGAWVTLEIVVIAGQGLGVWWWAGAHLAFFILFAGLEVGFLQICLALHDGQPTSFFGYVYEPKLRR